MQLGPDARRYLIAALGARVSRPFNVRWLLPVLCRTDARRWWAVYLASWPVAAAGMVAWRLAAGDSLAVAVAAMALLVGLPGVLGPSVVIPVGVDLPATAVTLCAVAGFAADVPVVPWLLLLAAACIRETAPVWAALWLWSPWPLLVLVAPCVAHLVRRPGPDPLGPQFQQIADHPIRSAIEFHRGRWRDAWLMVAPWGVTLAALYDPSPWVIVTLAAAYLQLLVATDTVRLVQHAAGPVMAAAAAQVIPGPWLVLGLVAHVWWWRTPERI